MDITALTNRPQSTPPPGIGRNTEWYPSTSMPPSSSSVVDRRCASSLSSAPSGDYHLHQYNQRSLPRPPPRAHSSSHDPLSHYSLPHHSYSHSPRRFRSTTSPEIQNRSQTRGYRSRDLNSTPLRSGISADTLQSNFSSIIVSSNDRGRDDYHGFPASYDHSSTAVQLSSNPEERIKTSSHHASKGNTDIDHSLSYTSHQHHGSGSADRWDLPADIKDHSSQSDYPLGNKVPLNEKYTPDNYPKETASEHSLSDSTQGSEISEPTHNRPRPRQHPRPSSAPKNYHKASRQAGYATLPSKGSVWLDEEGDKLGSTQRPQKQHFSVTSSYQNVILAQHPIHHNVSSNGTGIQAVKRHSISGPSSPHPTALHSIAVRRRTSEGGETLNQPPNRRVQSHMRKTGSYQKFSASKSSETSEAPYTDYPKSRKFMAIDQRVTESHMPEHVTISDNTIAAVGNSSGRSTPVIHPAAGIPKGRHTHQYDRVRTMHAYEQIEGPRNEDQNAPPPVVHSDINIQNPRAPIKGSSHWSPGIQKHSKDKVKSRAKKGKKEGVDVMVTPLKEDQGHVFSSTQEGQNAQHMMNRYFPTTMSSKSEAPCITEGGNPTEMTHSLSSDLGVELESNSTVHLRIKQRRNQTVPCIAVTRPSCMLEDVDINQLHRRFSAKIRNRASSLSIDSLQQAKKSTAPSKVFSSVQSSPKLKRSSSFRTVIKKRVFRVASDGVKGYEPLDDSYLDEVNNFSHERVISVSRAISRNSSPSSSLTSSPRPYRAMTLIPANNRIIHYDSSEESDEGCSNLDFGNAARGTLKKTTWQQWKALVNSHNEQDIEDSNNLNPPSKKAAGSRGKSAGSVMMKLAKKFSKRNLPIPRDDEDSDSLSSWKMRTRSNSVSHLESTEGMGRRSQSMEHLSQMTLDHDRTPVAGGIPQGSPHMVRSWSRGKLNRRSSEFDSDSGVMPSIFRNGSKRSLVGDAEDALFEAIEQGDLEAVMSLVEGNFVTKFNIPNADDLLPVDLSVMLGYPSIAQYLLDHGAKDSPKFSRDPSSRLSRIKTLITEAERELDRLKSEFVSQSASNSSGVKDAERKFKRGEKRVHLYKKMLLNYEAASVPGQPTDVRLHVTSNRSLMVSFSPPDEINNATVTRYKIEWCPTAEFKPVVGDFVMTDLRSMEYVIPDLDKGEEYFVRVSAYNMKGFGPTELSNPISAVPSSWHDLDNSQPRYEGSTDKMHIVAAQFGLTLQNAPATTQSTAPTPNTPSKTKSSRRTNPLGKRLSSVKFHKSLKPGVYIASLVYSDETKILVTTDDNVPIVEVSDATSSSIGSDFVWLANLACTWEQVQAMADITENYTSSPAVHFRNKLLRAILDLQNSLGIVDLGLLHPVPYKDAHGAIVFVIIQYAKNTRAVAANNSSLKWTDLPKLWKRRATPTRTTGLEAFPVPDQIVLETQEIIAHHHTSSRPLGKGLYLGYLKARSSVASMKVICSREYPNVLPHIKIRDNPNLNSEEWKWVKSLHSSTSPTSFISSPPHSLQHTLLQSIELLLKNLGFSKEEAGKHQLYVHEAIELNEDITILLVLPPHEHVCTAPGSSDHFAEKPDFVALPINTFEIMQLYTYQRSFMTKFSMVSTRLEVELLASHQQMREAFSKAEVTDAREKKTTLEDFSARKEQAWRQMRWIEDAVQKGRNNELGTDALLPIVMVRESIEKQRKEAARLRKEAEKKEDEAPPPVPLHRNKSVNIGSDGQNRKSSEEDEVKKSGHLRVIPSYRTGLARGTSVKLYIESTTTTMEVIDLVVKQVAKATGVSPEQDLSDFYLVAGISGMNEQTLDSDYHPLQLQLKAASRASKVYLLVKRKSEESQLNQLITSV